jgi:hypothetical protein
VKRLLLVPSATVWYLAAYMLSDAPPRTDGAPEVSSLGTDRRRSRFAGRRVHFVGIGGCGMSGLAGVLLDAGALVS